MKIFLVIFVLYNAAIIEAIPNSAQNKIIYAKQDYCISKTGASSADVETFKSGGSVALTDALTCFFDCIVRQLGFLNSAGNYQYSVVSNTIVKLGFSQDVGNNVAADCQATYGSDCNSGESLFECFVGDLF